MAKSAYFGPGLFQFLTELKDNNDREWFQANKARYEEQARDPFLRLIADLRPGFEKINPKIVVDPSPTRGSMMRIYRDIRFSADKSPYKLNLAAHFRHARAKEDAVPGYYIHLEPQSSMMGAGIWHPEPRAVQKIRNAIAANPKRWRAVRAKHEMFGESLKRAPAGYALDHPLIEDLKRKDFAVSLKLDDSEVCGTKLLRIVLDRFSTAAPFVEFLTEAVGLK
jgi:uncharacterized protein (TIGR02453 family)